MANEKNLKPFKKGQSGNIKGRPPKLPQLDTLLSDTLGRETADGRTEAHAILEALVKAAKKGNVAAGVALLNRAYGQPKQPVEHGGPNGKDLEFGITQTSQDKIASLLSAINGASGK